MIFAIPYTPILYIPIGPLKIYIWGLFFALAFLIASEWASRKAEAAGFPRNFISSLTMVILLGAVVGGRLGFILTNLDQYTHFLDIFKVWEGGMAFYGGFIGAILFSLPFLRKHHQPFFAVADFVAPFGMLGYFITRIGCTIVGDHIGLPDKVPWSIYYYGAYRHPISAYHAATGLFIFFFLYRYPYRATGERFFLMLLLYGIGRFLTEFFREEPFLLGLHLAQWISLALILAGAFGTLWSRAKQRSHAKPARK